MISAPATRIHPAEANASIARSHKTVGLFESEEREKIECLSGFIFLCNHSTKYECYRYRVFGLPLGKRKVVEEIKPGAKLFLFDFELKRLYGVYEATTVGSLYLEPEAFGGKYPAQEKEEGSNDVKFRIFKECLPILESSLRHIIKENYKGTKFKQELSGMQVTKLISSFRPLHTSQTLANKSLPGAMPPPVMENQLQHIEKLPVKDVPYPAEGRYNHIQPSKDPRSALNINQERRSYIREAIRCYGAHPQPSFAKEVAPKAQEPSYSRYITLEGSAMHDEVTVSGRQYRQSALQNEALYQNSVAVAYNSDSTAKEQYIPAATLTQTYASYHQFPHHSSKPAAPSHTTSGSHQQVPAAYLPLQKEALHQDNVAAYNSNSTVTVQYTPSVIQTQPAASYHQLADHGSNPVTPGGAASASHQEAPAAYFPSQNEASHQEKVAAYNSYSTATDQYTPSVMQTQPYASYHQFSDHSSNHAAQSQHTTSDSQQQVPAAYPHLQTEAQHQDSVTQYNYDQMALAQYASSVMQAQVPFHYGQYQGSVDAYSSNPAAPTQYDTSVFQSQVYATHLPQGEAFYQHYAAPYYSNPTVPVQYASVQQPQVSATNLPLQGEALHQVNVAAYNTNPMAGNQYASLGGQPEVPPGHAVTDGSAPIVSYFPYSAADHPSR